MISQISPKAIMGLEAKLKTASSINDLFIEIVNELRHVIGCEQIFIFSKKIDLRLEAVSDVNDFDRNAKVSQDIEKLANKFYSLNVFEFQLSKVYEHLDFRNKSSFHDYFLGLEVISQSSSKSYFLLFNKASQFSEDEKSLLKPLRGILGFYLGYFNKQNRFTKYLQNLSQLQKKIAVGFLFLFGVFLAFYKVPLQSFASAEVIPIERIALNSPTNGKISAVFVVNNQAVKKGEKLFEFDNFENLANYENAKIQLEALEYELNRAIKIAAIDPEVKGTISRLQDEIAFQQNELNFQKNLMERTAIFSPEDGIILIENSQTLIGTPFQIGQTVGEIIDPNSQKILIQKSASDGINLEIGAEIKFFLNSDPFTSHQARIIDFSYKPSTGIDGSLVFDVIAVVEGNRVLPVGARGNARIYGNKVSVFTYWFQAPMVYLRHYFCGIFTC